MNALAKFLKCDVIWLQHGHENVNNANVSNPGPYRPAPKYPVIGFVQAVIGLKLVGHTLSEIDEWYESSICSRFRFWLKVEGNDSVSTYGCKYPRGSLV